MTFYKGREPRFEHSIALHGKSLKIDYNCWQEVSKKIRNDDWSNKGRMFLELWVT